MVACSINALLTFMDCRWYVYLWADLARYLRTATFATGDRQWFLLIDYCSVCDGGIVSDGVVRAGRDQINASDVTDVTSISWLNDAA
jgi:hypothetical protein